jgi:regulatory protein
VWPVSPSTSEPGRPGTEADADPYATARIICLRLLAAAPRTRAQLARALGRRGVPAQAGEAVLNRFTELGLIDDVAYATAFVASRSGSRASGRRGIAAALAERGVDAEVAATALESLQPEDEAAAAAQFARSRAGRFVGLPREVAVRRLAGQLTRRGFPASVVFRVVDEALSDAGG